MKTTSLIFAAALGLTITGSVAAQEQNKEPQNGSGPRAALRHRMLHQFDADKDGKLNDAERAAAKAQFPEIRKQIIAKHDTDADGKLNDAERAAAKEQFQARFKEVIAKFDTDGDGKLNEQERKAAREAYQNSQH